MIAIFVSCYASMGFGFAFGHWMATEPSKLTLFARIKEIVLFALFWWFFVAIKFGLRGFNKP